ncbi:MAG: FAD-binding protein [Pseudomonadota bacterium]
MQTLRKTISGWGRYPMAACQLRRPERHAELSAITDGGVARGMGRSYGDAALNADGPLLLTERLNRFCVFDPQQGRLIAEAGTTLAEVLELVVPQGWFPLVTPGTRFVTLGGCIAADVHGKNHHRDGGFAQSVEGFELFGADGQVYRCSPEDNTELFRATLGGMGLTGAIGDVTLQLQPVESAYIRARHTPADDLEQALHLLADEEHDARYTVAWIDLASGGRGLGRSVVMAGEHATKDELTAGGSEPLQLPKRGRRNVPVDMPGWLLNPLSIRAFNALYYRLEGRKRQPFITDYERFFYPLDALGSWNRLYGKQGFLQYQCVVPEATAATALRQLLERLRSSGHAAFLGVLKRLGAEGEGYLSFPMPGYTLAMDLPMRGDNTLALMERLDEVVLEHGGRVYLAKDARLSAESFHRMYPRLKQWQQVKAQYDPQGRVQSSLSRRLRLGGET